MQIVYLSILTLPFDLVRTTTIISLAQKTNNDTPPPLIQVRYVYPERSTFMTDHREDNTTDSLLEPSDTPISPGTIRAVVVVGLITLFVASFLYWQSWKERHKRTPCVTKLKQGISDVVNAQCNRVRANRALANADSRRNDVKQETTSPEAQRDQRSSAIPSRIKSKILADSPVHSSSHSTSPSPSTSSSIYHSPASSQMILVCETIRAPTMEHLNETLTLEQLPRGYNLSTTNMPNEQIVLHV